MYRGEKIIPIANSDDKRLITVVLAASMVGKSTSIALIGILFLWVILIVVGRTVSCELWN